MSLWKAIKIYRVQKKKNIPIIFLAVEAKKFTNNWGLLFKMLMISGKREKSPTENNDIAAGVSSKLC